MLAKNEYYLLFNEGDHWIRRILKKDFNHITVLTKDSYNWITINPRFRHLNWVILPISSDEDAIKKYYSEFKCIKICTGYSGPKLGAFGFINCIKLARYITGLHVNALTPYKLYKKLLKIKHSGKPIFNLFSIELIK